ncbi:MAG: ribbon-helix-helix protein, CopG family [Bryobacteraceae bacterium]|nr:ribbon-helix-helix protein, CopG family [Bryobacteraceae bacterium]
MVRTQIQLPDKLYRDLKALAAQQEWTMAETVRRSVEEYLERHPVREGAGEKTGRLPKPMKLGAFLRPVEEWRELANVRALNEDDD